MRRNGFTLVELLVVVAIMATIAGAAAVMYDGAGASARAHMTASELSEIRQAVLRFRADMDESPRYIAELLQPPDPADENGGWWWRGGADALPASMRQQDPATRRGWDGPYVRAAFYTGTGNAEGREIRISIDGTTEQIDSDESATPPHRLAMLLSEGQHTDVARVISDYRLEFNGVAEGGATDTARLRFVGLECHPRRAASSLDLGVRP